MRKSSTPDCGGIYIISYREDKRFYKLGKARDFRARIGSYQTHVPYTIDIDLLYPITPYTEVEAETAELNLQAELEFFWLRGEWYDKNSFSIAFVHELQSQLSFRPFEYKPGVRRAEFYEFLNEINADFNL